jgi:cell pole-organizing protein PopZ
MGEVQQDPSMEEILASIKRVIREDARPPAQPRRGKSGEPSGSSDDDVLELNGPIDEPGPTLVSDDAAAASRQSLAALSSMRETAAADQGALEAVVRDMLRPMLKDWLDQNLPLMVEELVTREIARITGRKL